MLSVNKALFIAIFLPDEERNKSISNSVFKNKTTQSNTSLSQRHTSTYTYKRHPQNP